MIAPALDKKLVAAAAETGFTKALPLLRREARECLILGAARTKGKPPVGASRIGGRPDLPKALEWPAALSAKGKPFGHASFIAQLNFAEIPKIADLPIPRKGMLWIFGRAWNDGIPLASIYDPDPGKLAARTPPSKDLGGERGLRAPAPDEPAVLRFTRGLSLPFSRRHFLDDVQRAGGDPDNEPLRLGWALGQELDAGKIGGYSFMMEHDLHRWCAFRALGKRDAIFADYWDSMADYERSIAPPRPDSVAGDDRLRVASEKVRRHRDTLRPFVEWIDANRQQIADEAAAWRLLLSIRAGFAGLELGDGYSLEIFIRADALAAGDFAHLRAEAPMVF